MFRLPSLLVAMVAIWLLVAQPVMAHGYLIRAIPEERAVLEHAPARLQYWFSEALEARFSTVSVRDQNGTVVATGSISPDNNSLLTVRLPTDLPDGAYIVDMRLAFSSDGHVIAQSRVFFVGQEVGNFGDNAVTNQANLLEIVWRTLLLPSVMLLFGAFALYSNILVPAWGNPTYRAGWLPPRVMQRLNMIVIGALAVALLGNVLAILQQAAVYFNTDLGQVITQNLWGVVRVATRFGDLWNARMLLLVLVAAFFGLSLYFRDEQPELVRPFWTANVWAMALVIGTFSAGSHAAGSLIMPWVAVINDWLHALAVGFWAGGLGALVLVLPAALQPYSGDARRQAMLAALQRFSRLAVACVAIVITSGIYSALNWLYQPSDLTQTAFGETLLLKIVLVAGLLLAGLAHHVSLHPERYQRWTERMHAVLQPFRAFWVTLRLEVVLVVLVMASVGILSATPLPVPYFIQTSADSPTATETVGNLNITHTITPGGPGANTYDIQITQDGKPVDGLDVRVQLVNPERDWRGKWEAAEPTDSGLYVAAGGEIDREGRWWSLVNIRGADRSIQRAAFEWTISNAASVQQSRPPGIQHILALLAVLAVIGWIMYPTAHRFYQRLDLNATNVTVAVGAVVACVFFVILGIALIQNTQTQYQNAINPPPDVVNPILPDTASLERGKQLYQQECQSWQKADLKGLVERLPRTRDDDLYDATRQDWQGLTACEGTLSDAERWDVVNYIRTFETVP